MSDLDALVKVSALAAPLAKTIIDTFVSPKLTDLGKRWRRKNAIIDHSFDNKFQDYLQHAYERYSVINTIIFKNREKLLKRLYIPLEVVSEQQGNCRYTINEEYQEDFLPFYKKVLITDSAGMGKSTLMKRLFLSIIDNSKGVPVLIELRRLSERNGIIEEILTQLKSINEEVNREFLLDLIKRGDFVFLLDGFDEIPLAERKLITTEIRSFTTKASNNYFVLTSRNEGALTAFSDFKQFSIRPLSIDEAYDLLRKYDPTGKVSELLIEKLEEADLESIEEFLTNPLLVSLLYTAFEHKQTVPFKKHVFYRQVFDALFESHDLTKGDSFTRDKHSGLDIDDFHRVLRFVGFRCFTKDKIEFTKDEVLALLAEAKRFTTGIDFQPSDFLKDLVGTVPLFTIDGIYYKWAHRSLQEYFCAQFIHLDSKNKQKDILLKLYYDPFNDRFFNLFDLYYSIDPASFREVIIFQLLTDYFDYLKKSYALLPESKCKKERQALTFNSRFFLIRLKYDKERANSFGKKVFDYLPEHERRRGWILRHTRGNISEKLDHIKLAVLKKPTYSIMLFLASYGDPIIYSQDEILPVSKISLEIPDNTGFLIDDDNETFVEENDLCVVNEILKHNLGARGLYIEEKKALELLKEIESEISRKNESDYLLDF